MQKCQAEALFGAYLAGLRYREANVAGADGQEGDGSERQEEGEQQDL